MRHFAIGFLRGLSSWTSRFTFCFVLISMSFMDHYQTGEPIAAEWRAFFLILGGVLVPSLFADDQP